MSDIKIPRAWDKDGWTGTDDYPQANIEIETDGTSWGTVLKINGEPVQNCTGLDFTIKVGDLARATVHFEDVPIRFTGRMDIEAEEAQS